MNSIISTYFINIGGRREEGIHKVGKNTLRKLRTRTNTRRKITIKQKSFFLKINLCGMKFFYLFRCGSNKAGFNWSLRGCRHVLLSSCSPPEVGIYRRKKLRS